MPLKKKKSKASKFARMSDEERARYLQHRAELELEAKRRKQQLIAGYSKLKLKHEEIFSRLNNAKINEQWRFILRKIKCKELHKCTEYMWRNFDTTVQAKDNIIYKLYEQLHTADLDHRRLQEAHIDVIDRLIERSKQRFHFLREIYSINLHYIKSEEITEFGKVKEQVAEAEKNLRMIMFTQERNVKEKLEKTKTRNVVNILTLDYSNKEALSCLKINVHSKMQNLWLKLNREITEYETSIENKRKQYEHMKELDDTCRAEAAQFPKLQSQLLNDIEKLKNDLHILTEERQRNIAELRKYIEQLTSRVWKLRQEMKLSQTVDTVHLKQLSVISNGIIKNLQGIMEKGLALQSFINKCHELKSVDLVSKNHSSQDLSISEQISATNVDLMFEAMHRFWEQYNHVKVGNVLLKKEQNYLILENNRMRHALRSYLVTMSSVPSIRSNE